jgi:DNA mismatch repair protein MutS2
MSTTPQTPSRGGDKPKAATEKTLAALGWPELLRELESLCHSDRGRACVPRLPLLADRVSVEKELGLVAEARALAAAGEPLPFGEVPDLADALLRLQKEGALAAPTLLEVRTALRSGARLRRFLALRAERAPDLARLAAGIEPLEEVSRPIDDAFDDRGELQDNASPELFRLRQRTRELHERLTRRMRTLLEEPRLAPFLQDHFYTLREDRYVLPVRTDAGPVLEGIVHGSSATGATVFVEPQEVVGLNNQLKVAEIEARREEARILLELSGLVQEMLPSIEKNLGLLERLDLVDARARLAEKLAASRPTVSEDGRVLLVAMRHPVLCLGSAEVVPNDLELEPGRALVITGPNAGGKTVCLKTLGLFAVMLRAGMHLPAGDGSRLPLFDGVRTEMGDDQSLADHLSTFTAHLSHLLDFLETARPGTLLLLDDIGIGTDPGEGAALAQALLEAFVETGAQVVATTHYERLKALAYSDRRFDNASVGYDLSRMVPTYHLHRGIPGSSGAISVARRLGLAPKLADRAAALLEKGPEDLSRLLAELAAERTTLEREREVLATERARARALEEKHRAELERLRAKGRAELDEAQQRALEELRRARADLERIRAQLKRPPDPVRLKQADREISGAAKTILEHERARAAPASRPARPEELTVGARVIAPQLGGLGEVIEAPQRGRVAVRVGGLRTLVPIAEVMIPLEAPAARTKGKPAHSRPEAPRDAAAPAPATPRETPLRTAAITLDVRGLRVDEAIAETDRFLDGAMRAEEPVLFLLHGHGTGALKSALRDHLSGLAEVSRIRPADLEDGGDGVTVIFLA